MKADVLVVGAGPAGLSAAEATAQGGRHTVVLDEFPVPGGRLLGQFHREPSGAYWVGQRIARDLLEKSRDAGVDVQSETSVYGIVHHHDAWQVLTTKGAFVAEQLLLATGASEVPTPVPGWTLPGVISIGAAQVLTNVHFVKPGTSGVVVGVNVLSLAITEELRTAGVDIKAIVLQPAGLPMDKTINPAERLQFLGRMAHLAPRWPLRLGARIAAAMPQFAVRFYPKGGVRLSGAPLRLRTRIVSIDGKEAVEGVTLTNIAADGRELERFHEQVDFVAVSGGLAPLAELAAVAGCPLDYVAELGGYVPRHNERLQSTLPNLYVAGNITGVESAMVAMAQGRLAGISMLHDAGLGADADVEQAKKEVMQVRAAALIQFDPGIAAARQRLYHDHDATITLVEGEGEHA